MAASEKNRKYLGGIEAWQKKEIDALRDYCHKRGKDFYVIDDPPAFEHVPLEEARDFLRDIKGGFSNVAFARKIAARILEAAKADTVTLVDGDRTLIVEDSSRAAF